MFLYLISSMFKSGLIFRSINLTRRTITTRESEVILETHNKAGIVTLNRPKSLNCLTSSMISEIIPKLQDWQLKQSLIIMKGAGGKAFCAGGDAKIIIDKKRRHELFCYEFNLVQLINTCRVPWLTFIDGYTIGGGLGLSISGKYAIATERTQMSMPEHKLGLSPGLGATYVFPRLKSKLGFYLGLTGTTLKGNDAVQAGLATHLVPSDRLTDLEKSLSMCADETQINTVLSKFCEKSIEFSLAPYVKNIEYCFSAPTLSELMKRLETTNNEWSTKTLETLHQASPGLLNVTFRAFQASSNKDFKECLMMEYGILCHAIENHDFAEGVRALLLDKDNNPKWNPRTLSEVTNTYVDSFFQKLPIEKELTFVI